MKNFFEEEKESRAKIPRHLDGSYRYQAQIIELKTSLKWVDTLNGILAVVIIVIMFIEVTAFPSRAPNAYLPVYLFSPCP